MSSQTTPRVHVATNPLRPGASARGLRVKTALGAGGVSMNHSAPVRANVPKPPPGGMRVKTQVRAGALRNCPDPSSGCSVTNHGVRIRASIKAGAGVVVRGDNNPNDR